MTDSPHTSEQATEAAGAQQAEQAYLTPVEARLLGVLMEKQLTVPDSYPLTLNSLTLGCNQKSNREPVMNLTEGEVGACANTLAERGLVRIEYGERAHRFEHKVRSTLKLSKEQLAVLTTMLLRAPQTLNEIKVRTQRSWGEDDLAEILLVVESLVDTDAPKIAKLLPKSIGQREERYAHLLCGDVEPDAATHKAFVPPSTPNDELSKRLEALESKLAELQVQLQDKGLI